MQPPIHRWTHIDQAGNSFSMEFTDVVFLNDILEKFELFLKGVGFCTAGKLEWVPTSEETEGYGEHEEDPKFI